MSSTTIESLDTFGELLRHLRRRIRLTQRDLGIAVGYSEAHIGRLESNERRPEVATVSTRFIEALHLQHEPHLSARLIELAKLAHGAARNKVDTRSAFTNLPCQFTHFVGRKQELDELLRLVNNHRLVTVTGAGGIGKTRLAIEAGNHTLYQFPGGVWWIELAPLSNMESVVRAIMNVLALPEPEDDSMEEVLVAHLRSKHLLLMLDNCEHLIAACAGLVEHLLHACPQLHVLATSREPLKIMGEHVLRVQSLAFPNVESLPSLAELREYEAVQLYAQHATMTQPKWQLSSNNAPAVALICAHLDGMPLAIQMAAAQVRAFSDQEIFNQLNDRFVLFTNCSHNALSKHQTLQATMDWSYTLLGEAEQILFARLSIFRDAWTSDSANNICGDGLSMLPMLCQLVDKSLVVVSPQQAQTRYYMLETIREYASMKLHARGEAQMLQDRHLFYFLKLAEQAKPQLEAEGSAQHHNDQIELVQRLSLDINNFRMAMDWSQASGRSNFGLRIATALFWLWIVRGEQDELLDWIQSVIAQTSMQAASKDHIAALVLIFELLWRQHEFQLARLAAERALEISLALGAGREQADAFAALIKIHLELGETVSARNYYERWLEIAPRVFDEDRRRRNDLLYAGLLAIFTNDYVEAEQAFFEWKSLEVKGKSKMGASAASRWLGYALLNQGKLEAAHKQFSESLVDNAALGDRHAVAGCLSALGAHSLFNGMLFRSARLFGASESILDNTHLKLIGIDRKINLLSLATLRTQLSAENLHPAWATGRAMSLHEATDYALSS